jgi:2-polyprenyl-3-methyl-5-hydroxy-6-metoxy-1,4-benzoquinol methylase
LHEKEQLQRSWIANASAWRDAVRERKIASRRIATDAAIINTVLSLHPRRALDLGCGEGWLARTLSAQGIEVVGIDASAPLIDAAKELGGGSFHALSYEAAGDLQEQPFDVGVVNFAILDDDMQPLLAAATKLLKSDGALIIQTTHPAFIDGDYIDGWRTETFAAVDGEWKEPMPWYFRTIATWTRDLMRGGFSIHEIREPADASGSRPLSIIFICRKAS